MVELEVGGPPEQRADGPTAGQDGRGGAQRSRVIHSDAVTERIVGDGSVGTILFVQYYGRPCPSDSFWLGPEHHKVGKAVAPQEGERWWRH